MTLLLFFYWIKLFVGTLFGTGFQLFKRNWSNQKTADKGLLPWKFSDTWQADKKIIKNTYAGVFAVMLVIGAGLHSSLTHTASTPEPFFFDVIWFSRRDIFEAVSIVFFMTLAYMGLDFVLAGLGKSSDIIKERLANTNLPENKVV